MSESNYFPSIVIGLGAIGSATVYQLAKQGTKVLGIEQFSSPHTHGSSHGDSRITRTAIGEGSAYTPLALRSHQIWREIENLTGLDLFHQTGGIIISSNAPKGVLHVENFFENTLSAAKKFNISHQIYSSDQVSHKFPQFSLDQDEFAYYEPDAGYLIPENCIKAQLKLAVNGGATLKMNEKLISYFKIGTQIKVVTDLNEYVTNKLILTTGGWLPSMLPSNYTKLMQVRRQVLYWFNIDEEAYTDLNLDKMPVFIWEMKATGKGIYGFPAIKGLSGGLKIATESIITSSSPKQIDHTVKELEIDEMYNSIKHKFPYLNNSCVKTATCMYTVTPDHGFIIDPHPDFSEVLIVSPCSGHGFKHSAALGEAIAQQVGYGVSEINLDCFRSNRF